jgi:hypothetical protein
VDIAVPIFDLRLLWILVFLGFFQRAILQSDGRVFRARHQTNAGLLAG